MEMYANEQALYLTTTHGLYIFDVSTPTTPSLLGSYKTPSSVIAMDVHGEYAYIIDADTGLYIINIVKPQGPVLESVFKFPGISASRCGGKIVINDGYAYVLNFDFTPTLFILNISQPKAPVLTTTLTKLHMKLWGDVAIQGNFAYIVNDIGLHVMDISTPDAPVTISEYAVPGESSNIYIEGNYAYITEHAFHSEPRGLSILDISNPHAPTLAGFYEISGRITDINVQGNMLYLMNRGDLLILDIGPRSRETLTAKSVALVMD
jgi:hypothetical protein